MFLNDFFLNILRHVMQLFLFTKITNLYHLCTYITNILLLKNDISFPPILPAQLSQSLNLVAFFYGNHVHSYKQQKSYHWITMNKKL